VPFVCWFVPVFPGQQWTCASVARLSCFTATRTLPNYNWWCLHDYYVADLLIDDDSFSPMEHPGNHIYVHRMNDRYPFISCQAHRTFPFMSMKWVGPGYIVVSRKRHLSLSDWAIRTECRAHFNLRTSCERSGFGVQIGSPTDVSTDTQIFVVVPFYVSKISTFPASTSALEIIDQSMFVARSPAHSRIL
jgi:hypothetical protein